MNGVTDAATAAGIGVAHVRPGGMAAVQEGRDVVPVLPGVVTVAPEALPVHRQLQLVRTGSGVGIADLTAVEIVDGVGIFRIVARPPSHCLMWMLI
jgi:hypothetical protein